MWPLRISVFVVVLTGCHLRAGLDAASQINGPLHTAMTQSSMSSNGVTNLPSEGGRSYTVEAGFGVSALTVNSVVAVHDVTSSSFTPGAGYLASTFGLDVRWQVLRWHGLSPSLAAGPGRMLLLDRTTGDMAWGNALRFGAGAQYQLGPIAIYGDLYREVAVFSGGVAQGTSNLQGLTFGVALQP